MKQAVTTQHQNSGGNEDTRGVVTPFHILKLAPTDVHEEVPMKLNK